MHKVLLVDDEKNILSGYKRNLRSKFHIYVADNGYSAIKIMNNHGPFAAVVSDYKMPEMNGIDFLANVKQYFPDSVRMMLTGFADLESLMSAINEGNIFRFLTKPCSVDQLEKNIFDAIEQYKLIVAEKDLLNKTLKGSIKMLIDILMAVNPEAFSRASKFRNQAKAISERLGKKASWDIEVGALLSPIGLVTLPEEILSKKNDGDDLTDEEKKLYYSHPEVGEALLKNIPRLENIAEGINYQYCNYNGEGGIKDYKIGENIPFIGRMLKIFNDFEELNHLNISDKQAIEMLYKKHELYDPDILGAFEAEISGFGSGQIISTKTIDELEPGMILAEGIKDKDGFLLLPQGSQLTNVSVLKLINYGKVKEIPQPFKVVEYTDVNNNSVK